MTKPRRTKKSDSPKVVEAAAALISAIAEEPLPEPLPEGPVVVTERGTLVSPAAPREVAVPYNAELAEQITDMYIAGQSLYKISTVSGMPSYTSLLRWFRDNADFRAMIEAGRQLRALHHEEEALRAAEEADHKDDVPAARLKFDAHAWAAEVNDPARYGKKTTIGGDPSRPIVFKISTGVPEPTEARTIELNKDGTVKDQAKDG